MVFALPDVRTPIDPEKRARFSTRDAVRPSAMTPQGNGVVGGRIITPPEVAVGEAAIDGERAAIQVRETRDKTMIATDARPYPVRSDRDLRRSSASDLPASIPRLRPERFQRILTAYEKGRTPATEMLRAGIDTDEASVDIGEINRFANPRRVLEEQGIPVREAGSGEPPPAGATPVPVSKEKG